MDRQDLVVPKRHPKQLCVQCIYEHFTKDTHESNCTDIDQRPTPVNPYEVSGEHGIEQIDKTEPQQGKEY